MQTVPSLTGHIDIALVVLYAFWIFFFGLVVYLQRESRREGFPMVADTARERRTRTGDLGLATPPRKRYLMLFDGLIYVPEAGRADTRPIAAVPATPAPGSPLIPTGNPLVDGVGPASYAPRVPIPERTVDGHDRIVPLRVSIEHFVAAEDRDPRGMHVFGADGRLAGTVTDLWIDRSEGMVRYLELALPGAPTPISDVAPTAEEFAQRVLMPIGFANVNGRRGRVDTSAITAAQFADVPRIADPSRVTLAEEDRLVGYFGGGALYATPRRSEPLL